MSSHSTAGVSGDRVIELALELPDVRVAPMQGSMVIKRADKFMLRPMTPGEWRLDGYAAKNPDASVFAFCVTWEVHDELLGRTETIFFKKPHYEGYAALLVDSSDLSEETARFVVNYAWEAAGPKRQKRRPKVR